MRVLMLSILPLVLAGCGRGDCCGEVAWDTTDGASLQQRDSARADTAWTLRFDGAGPLRVGMTVEEARAAMGGDFRQLTPDGSEPITDPDLQCDYAESARLPVGVGVMLERGRVVRVEVVDSASPVATAEGARIGDTEARIQRLYPGRVEVQPHKYTDGHYLLVRPAAASDTTHLLVFDTDGRVVTRFRAGQKPQVEYVEGCA